MRLRRAPLTAVRRAILRTAFLADGVLAMGVLILQVTDAAGRMILARRLEQTTSGELIRPPRVPVS
ncbi:hypothetical protein GCM10008171_31600 [Methylopila jiangsuensis]|uniref:Uncharacterized protein n=1 Tax=Methylopila jiangsuensis TaxID=586230 RepID=A0A9W6N547_9HYPH|nr:hypothetical protein GCM10008171_31600 [Methylopila jiangsuensis]